MRNHTIEDLREQIKGDVITSDDPGYDEARRVYNAMIDRRPSVVVRCAEAEDVVATVDYARENGFDLAVRGGGHSVPGFERHNLTMRMQIRRFTRLTNAFSKKVQNHVAAVALDTFFYNLGRPHRSLANPYPRTPAMAAGLADHI